MAFANVYLCHLRTGTIARVGDVKGDRHVARCRRRRKREILVRKGSVGKTIAEWEQWLGSRLVITPVAHENALRIRHPFVSAFRIVSIMGRIFLPFSVESDGQFS